MTAPRALPAAVALALLAPAAAHGATLTTDRQCYVQVDSKQGLISQTLTFTGAGWGPGTAYTLTGDQVTASGTADEAGNFTSSGTAPTSSRTDFTPQEFTVTGQQDGTDVATATFQVVNFLVKPRSTFGKPTGKTTWSFSGFTPAKTIFVHVKKGSKVYTARAGKGDATCGTLKTKLRRLPAVPPAKIKNGKYKVIVDNRRRYKKGGLQYTATITIS